MLQTEPCNACGSLRIAPWKVIGGHRLLRCRTCRLACLYPAPSSDELQALYDEKYFHSDCVETESHSARSVGERMALLERLGRHGSVLDVGCGTGGFLAEAQRRGWRTKGLEISSWAAETARREGLDVTTGSVLDVDCPPGSFDVVSFWDTLEHLPDPAGALRRVRGWLRPDGVVIVRVVNCGSFDARAFGAAWRAWGLPYHLFHFCPRSLRTGLEKAGYEVISLRFGLSAVFFRFLFAPIAIPSHHAKLVAWTERRLTGLCRRLRAVANGTGGLGTRLRRLFPGPVMDAVARPRRTGT